MVYALILLNYLNLFKWATDKGFDDLLRKNLGIPELTVNN